ncbi:hypothetical protein V502_07761 [Pseudogymnoascus sp. VKM F-4520 (FW-2644)]|nr:hypothetical protein V502_07761 [Pseudogymnoascus sp. VKM F-4520 (FW-2644)]
MYLVRGAPLKESIGWVQIRSNSYLLQHTKKSLVAITDAAFQLGRGDRRSVGALNKSWEQLALEDWTAQLNEKAVHVNALPQVELSDGEDARGEDAGGEDARVIRRSHNNGDAQRQHEIAQERVATDAR